MSENPRIGKVLRLPIEFVTEDENKVNEMINNLGKIKDSSPDQDFDESIQQAINDAIEDSTGHDPKEIDKILKSYKSDKDGNLGDIVSMSKDQIGNVLSFAKSPSGFIFSVFLRRFAKGAGVIALAFLIMEAVKYAMEFLMRDGMPFDRRFKRYVRAEVLGFLDRLFKAQLRQGFRSAIVTTIGGLRGGRGQVTGNIYDLIGGGTSRLPANFYNQPVEAYSTKGLINLPQGNIRSNR